MTSSYMALQNSLNNLGHATGVSFLYTGSPVDQTFRAQGFVWQNGKLTALPLLNGYLAARTVSINDRDQVVGWATNLDFSTFTIHYIAVLWDHGQAVNLGTLFPGGDSFAYAINDWGTVVGCSHMFGAPSSEPTVWYGGTIHALPLLPGRDHGCAESINDFGVIAGREGTRDGSSQVPCLWYWNGSGYTAVSLGSLGGDYGDALGINNLGQIVGWTLYAGDLHGPGFLWDFRGMHALPTLPGDSDGQANAINDLGQITGFSWLFDDYGNLLSQRL